MKTSNSGIDLTNHHSVMDLSLGCDIPVICHKEHTILIAAIPTDPWDCLEWALALWEGCYGVSSNLHVQNTCLNLLH